jgi:hypothetical protein
MSDSASELSLGQRRIPFAGAALTPLGRRGVTSRRDDEPMRPISQRVTSMDGIYSAARSSWSNRMRARCEGLRRSLAIVPLLLATACGGDVLTLGQGSPQPAFGDGGQRVANINTLDYDEDSPTLTGDLLQIFFTSDRGGGMGGVDVWYATRRDRTLAFGSPSPLEAANSADTEVSPAISADGLTLWVGSDRPDGAGNLDIWRITRSARDAAWGPIENVSALNSPEDDIPRPLGQGARVMPFASRRDAPDAEYQTFFALRDDSLGEFRDVEPAASSWAAGAGVMDACMSEDGLLVFFNDRAYGTSDLYFAWRPTLAQPFGSPALLPEVNSEFDEQSPWLSADATRFFFASDRRDGGRDIYATWMDVPAFE